MVHTPPVNIQNRYSYDPGTGLAVAVKVTEVPAGFGSVGVATMVTLTAGELIV
jgi:hypothetical protein